MIVNADLHIHSRFSGGTSNKMTIDTLSKEAPRKGIDLLATGDCLHKKWMQEIKQCNYVDEGTFELNETRFILSTEIEDNNRVHHLLFFPCVNAVEEFKSLINSKCKNLETDGRPRLDMNGEEIAAVAKDVEALIGPAHAFTPWTALYAYHDSLQSCYGDLTSYISFLELGLSADSNYADRIEELYRLTFLSNSDCHSPHPVRLAREFNRFRMPEPSFNELRKAILRQDGNKPILNVGLPPREGKYNESACISCYKHYTLEEAIRRKWRCSCGKQIKKGVKDRVDELSEYPSPKHPSHRPPYTHIIPLTEIIAKAVGQKSPFTKTVSKRWEELIDVFGSEVQVLLDAELKDISKITAPAITEAIEAFRRNKVIIHPGGGGKYGVIKLPDEDNRAALQEYITYNKNKQKSLLDYE